MKIKRLNKISILSSEFTITWNNKHDGGSFSYGDNTIEIGTYLSSDQEIFMVLCHEIMEICAVEMSVRMRRPDCESDYIFVFDHRQFDTMMSLFASVISKFIKE